MIKRIDETIEILNKMIGHNHTTCPQCGLKDYQVNPALKIALASLKFAKWILYLTDKGGLLFSRNLQDKLKEFVENLK